MDDEKHQTEQETDPTGRFLKLPDVLGSGAFKTVWKAIDQDRGIEVAWNQLRLDRFQDTDFKKLYAEIQLLGQLKHLHIIEFYASWINEAKHEVVFITECMTSGTLKQFIKRARNLKLSVIKNFCSQILKGLNYLHTRSPPIIHRDIKCDNIFINGSLGEVKIGDLGLATVKKNNKSVLSVIGTPEFMAPEYYEEKYSEKVDIWAFGLCVLEMVTLDYPYSECTNPAQIFKRVSSGNLPAGLDRVKDEDVRNFIRLCLAPEDQRPGAAELLRHPFLAASEDERQLPSVVDGIVPLNGQRSAPTSMTNPHDERLYTIDVSEDEPSYGPSITDTQIVAVDMSQYEEKIILKLRLRVEDNLREIEFPFDLRVDTAATVAAEMVHALGLPQTSLKTIATLMQNHVDEATRQRQEKKRLLEQAQPPVQQATTMPIGTGSANSSTISLVQPGVVPLVSGANPFGMNLAPSPASSMGSAATPIVTPVMTPAASPAPTPVASPIVSLMNPVVAQHHVPSSLGASQPIVPPSMPVAATGAGIPIVAAQPIPVSLQGNVQASPLLTPVTASAVPSAPLVAGPTAPLSVPLVQHASVPTALPQSMPLQPQIPQSVSVPPSPKGSPKVTRKGTGSTFNSGEFDLAGMGFFNQQEQHQAQADEDDEFMNQMYQALLLKHQKEREALETRQAEELRRFEAVREKKRSTAIQHPVAAPVVASAYPAAQAHPAPAHLDSHAAVLGGLSLQQIDKTNQQQPQRQTSVPVSQAPPFVSTVSSSTLNLSSGPLPPGMSSQGSAPQVLNIQQHFQQQGGAYSPQPIPGSASLQQLPTQQALGNLQQSFSQPISGIPTSYPQQLQLQYPAQSMSQLQLYQQQQAALNKQQTQTKSTSVASKLTEITMKSLEAFTNSNAPLSALSEKGPKTDSMYPSLGTMAIVSNSGSALSNVVAQANPKIPTPPTSGSLLNTPVPVIAPTPSMPIPPSSGTNPIPIPGTASTSLGTSVPSCMSPPTSNFGSLAQSYNANPAATIGTVSAPPSTTPVTSSALPGSPPFPLQSQAGAGAGAGAPVSALTSALSVSQPTLTSFTPQPAAVATLAQVGRTATAPPGNLLADTRFASGVMIPEKTVSTPVALANGVGTISPPLSNGIGTGSFLSSYPGSGSNSGAATPSSTLSPATSSSNLVGNFSSLQLQ